MDPSCAMRIVDENYADLIFEIDEIPDSVKALPDFCVENINNLYSVAYLPLESLPDNLMQRYSYSVYPSCFGLMDLNSLEDTGVARIQNSAYLNLTGLGVLIGIIDTGIDYQHEAFKNQDGTTKIMSIWDQTIQDDGGPEGFYYGTEYTQEQINLALISATPLSVVPSTDENGHGTAVAGIAAGTRNAARGFSGVAQEAKIVVVKLKQAKEYLKRFFFIPNGVECYQENDIMQGIRYLLNVSRTLERPISICIGLGTSQGAHNLQTPLSNYITSISGQRGVGVSIAGGNEGNRGHHYSATVDPSIGYDTVELNIGPDNTGFSMELWGRSPNIFSIDLLSPTGQYVPRIPARLKETRELNFIFENTKVFVDYELVESQTGGELILIRFQNPMEGIWRFRVYSAINIEPNFNIWLPIHNFLKEGTRFVTPDPYYTLTTPGNASLPIVVAAYDYRNNGLYIYSSRGYTVENVINPSFAAPGVNMTVPGLQNSYTEQSGTSISAGFTAGVVAMLLEWGVVKGNQTQMDTLQIKNFLIRGAKRDPAMTFPNRDWGYGILDVYNAFSTLIG
ncbi:S8 family peptidase [Konateibacter massiliensis]|uniref:S8 family peptidase n=1 Tax=Konateibacter massiliensis TaxID=2002841 RepID=UPI000C161C0E|nr:S8 family peptidase [Konateibacter massiliensis]